MENIAKALVKAQSTIGKATKDRENPFYKSSYADLGAIIDVIKGPLNENGIVFIQATGIVDATPVVITKLIHISGEMIEGNCPIVSAKPNDPQAFGSAMTYAKRYALAAMLGVATEDDDGEGAMNRKQEQKPSQSEGFEL